MFLFSSTVFLVFIQNYIKLLNHILIILSDNTLSLKKWRTKMNREYDYIQTLSAEERHIFVECFCCMVYSDSKVAKEEIAFLKNIGKMYGIEEKEIVSILQNLNKASMMEKVSKIRERQKSLQLIKELCYLANSDTGLDDEEIDFIIDVAESMHVDSEKLKQINKWVLDKIVLLKTGNIILETE